MKNLFFGLVVAAVAMGTSAFTVEKEAAKRAKLATGDIWVNTNNSGTYQQLVPASAYDDTNCQDANAHICSFIRTPLNPSTTLPATMTAAQIAVQDANGLLTENSERFGVYEP